MTAVPACWLLTVSLPEVICIVTDEGMLVYIVHGRPVTNFFIPIVFISLKIIISFLVSIFSMSLQFGAAEDARTFYFHSIVDVFFLRFLYHC